MTPTSMMWNRSSWVEVEARSRKVFLTMDGGTCKWVARGNPGEARHLAALLLEAAGKAEEKP